MDDTTKAAITAAVDNAFAKLKAVSTSGLAAVNMELEPQIHWAQKYWWLVAVATGVFGYWLHGALPPVHVSVG